MSSHSSEHFVLPIKYVVIFFAALVGLTVLNLITAQYQLGPWNLYIAMGLAVVKAVIIVWFFMGLHWDKGFNAAIFLSSLLFIMIFVLFTLADVLTRGFVSPEQADYYGLKSPVHLISKEKLEQMEKAEK